MIEYFMLQEIQAQQTLATIFGLFPPRYPLWWWWYQLEREAQDDGIRLYLLPRDPDWLHVKLPEHVARMRTIAFAIVRDADDAEEAVETALMRTERVPHVPNDFAAYLD